MQPELLHQQNGHQRAEHAHRQQQLVGRGVAVPEKQQAGIDLQQPRHAKGEQKVQAEALFFFCRHTNFTAVP